MGYVLLPILRVLLNVCPILAFEASFVDNNANKDYNNVAEKTNQDGDTQQTGPIVVFVV